ncbi:MAG: 1-deoxy-D-xylulose-5-phosphate synthase [Alicyclobacillaceae bacterium]|nr:1-deoxy-D-xylulose-5-phosphate synthase [Alicyclobacillaceae bacterium]
MLLDRVDSPSDLKRLSLAELQQLAGEIRQFLIEQLSVTGGHFGPNLGVVELTLALHRVFDSPVDKIIWDVGHQAYVHKIVTGRKHRFPTLRQFGGMSGFPKRKESPHDAFGTGHASTSISAALGMAVARDLRGEKHHIVAVIGDGAMTGGMAFEALNHAGHLRKKLIVVLNDNEMSIARNVGAISNYLAKLRTDRTYSKVKAELEQLLKRIPSIGDKMVKTLERAKDSVKYFWVPGMLFEELGFTYFGPVDGHDLGGLIRILETAKACSDPVVLHVVTQKGKGYGRAEEAPDKLHSVTPFNPATGKMMKPVKAAGPSYTSVFGDALVELAKQDRRIVAITAAMPGGTGLTKFAAQFPERFFDVGIAEQHAATLAAGLAAAGMRPVFAVYSTFLQRAYDQVIHDVCIQNLPVVFAVDRAGLVGADGETHQGVFDVAYLRAVPNMTVMMPKDENELRHMLFTALQQPGPVAVRYPRAEGRGVPLDRDWKTIPIGQAEIVRRGDARAAVLALGPMVEVAEAAADLLEKEGLRPVIVNARFVKPLDRELILRLVREGYGLVTVEETALAGGFGSAVLELLESEGCAGTAVRRLGLPDRFIEHGSREELLQAVGLTAEAVARAVREVAAAASGGTARVSLGPAAGQ